MRPYGLLSVLSGLYASLWVFMGPYIFICVIIGPCGSFYVIKRLYGSFQGPYVSLFYLWILMRPYGF